MQKHPFLYTNKETKTTKFNQHFFSGLVVSITTTTTTFVFVIDVSFNRSSRLYNWRSTTTTTIVVGNRKNRNQKTEKKYWSMIDQSIDQESKWMNFFHEQTANKQTIVITIHSNGFIDFFFIHSFIEWTLSKTKQQQNKTKTINVNWIEHWKKNHLMKQKWKEAKRNKKHSFLFLGNGFFLSFFLFFVNWISVQQKKSHSSSRIIIWMAKMMMMTAMMMMMKMENNKKKTNLFCYHFYWKFLYYYYSRYDDDDDDDDDDDGNRNVDNVAVVVVGDDDDIQMFSILYMKKSHFNQIFLCIFLKNETFWI